jgi:hypothetical protein
LDLSNLVLKSLVVSSCGDLYAIWKIPHQDTRRGGERNHGSNTREGSSSNRSLLFLKSRDILLSGGTIYPLFQGRLFGVCDGRSWRMVLAMHACGKNGRKGEKNHGARSHRKPHKKR